jgi:hypothetical protein
MPRTHRRQRSEFADAGQPPAGGGVFEPGAVVCALGVPCEIGKKIVAMP